MGLDLETRTQFAICKTRTRSPRFVKIGLSWLSQNIDSLHFLQNTGAHRILSKISEMLIIFWTMNL